MDTYFPGQLIVGEEYGELARKVSALYPSPESQSPRRVQVLAGLASKSKTA